MYDSLYSLWGVWRVDVPPTGCAFLAGGVANTAGSSQPGDRVVYFVMSHVDGHLSSGPFPSRGSYQQHVGAQATFVVACHSPPAPPPPLPPSPSPPLPPPPATMASLQAQLDALRALLPPTCTGSSFLQRTAARGWACAAPLVTGSGVAGWCRAGAGGGVTCDAAAPSAPPTCLPPGGKWLGYNASSGWSCICNLGWSGPACAASGGASAGCSAPPACSLFGNWTGLYRFVNGSAACDCGGAACAAPAPPPAAAPLPAPPPTAAPLPAAAPPPLNGTLFTPFSESRVRSVGSGLCWTIYGFSAVVMAPCNATDNSQWFAFAEYSYYTSPGYEQEYRFLTPGDLVMSTWGQAVTGVSSLANAGETFNAPGRLYLSSSYMCSVILPSAEGLLRLSYAPTDFCGCGTCAADKCLSAAGPVASWTGFANSLTLAVCNASDPMQLWTNVPRFLPPPPTPSPPSPPPSPPPTPPADPLHALYQLTVGAANYTVWQDTQDYVPWLLVAAGAGVDQTLCTNFSANPAELFSATINEAVLYGGPDAVSAFAPLAVHSLMHAAGVGFNALRVSTRSYTTSTAIGVVSGQQDYAFTFAGTSTLRDLMLTTASEMLTGPTFSAWRAGFGADRAGSPFFVRSGSGANTQLSSAGSFGCSAGCTPAFAYEVTDGTCTVDVGIGAGTAGGNCGSCRFAGSEGGFSPVQVFVYGALAAPAPMVMLAPAPPAAVTFPGAMAILAGMPVWQDAVTDAGAGRVWNLVAAGFGNDQSLCGTVALSAMARFSTAVNESALYVAGGAEVTSLAVHRLMYTSSIFRAIRVTVINPPGASTPTGTMVGGRHDFVFTFNGAATAASLMFTTATTLTSGPSWNAWKLAFGYGRQSTPWFSRGGSSANSALGAGGSFSGPCPCVAGAQGPDFGYATTDGTCTVDTGLGVKCSHCSFAAGGDMDFNAHFVMIFASETT
jgi:hypothetical protein